MLNLAQIKKAEKVYDLGCGDGRLVFAAEQAGAKCTGIEISHPIYVLAFLRKVLTKKKTRLIRANIFKTSIKDADVIFLFLLPKLMERFYQEIYPTLKPNTRIISNAFQIKSLKPVQKINKKQNGQSSIYLFVKE
jgi:SAM-dependent methyltransferase